VQGTGLLVEQQLHVAADGRERRAQIVLDQGQHPVLEAVELEQALVALAERGPSRVGVAQSRVELAGALLELAGALAHEPLGVSRLAKRAAEEDEDRGQQQESTEGDDPAELLSRA